MPRNSEVYLRDILEAIGRGTTLGTDKWGNTWSARTLDDGTQAWVQTRGGEIVNGGLNQAPRDEVAVLLGSMNLADDGEPMDPAMWQDWLMAVQRAISRDPDAAG